MAEASEILLLSTEDAYTNVPSRLGKTVKHLNRLQDKLGKDHDLAVLKGFLVKHLNNPGNRTPVGQDTGGAGHPIPGETECEV